MKNFAELAFGAMTVIAGLALLVASAEHLYWADLNERLRQELVTTQQEKVAWMQAFQKLSDKPAAPLRPGSAGKIGAAPH